MVMSVVQTGVLTWITGSGAATSATGNFADTTNTPFASGDATNSGKMWVKGAGAAGADYTGTIQTFTDTGHVVDTPNFGTSTTTATYTVGDATGGGNGTTTLQIVSKSNTAAGNLLFLGINYDQTVTISSVTDTQGNTWTPCAAAITNATVGISQRAYYCPSCKGGALTVTVTYSASITTSFENELFFAEINSGGLGVMVLDQVATGNSTGTAMTTGSFTTKYVNEVIMTWVGTNSHVSTNATGFTAYPAWNMNSGGTGSSNQTANGNNMESEVVASIQSGITVSVTQASNAAFLITAVTFAAVPLPGTFYDMPPGGRSLHPSRDGTQYEAWPPRVASVAAPTEAYTSYPDTMQQRHRLHMEPCVFRPNAPERTAPYADQDFPDRVLRAKTAPDYFPSGFQGTVDDAGVDWSFPDTMRAAQPRSTDSWTTVGLPISAAPTEAYWGYPDRMVRATTAPDWWTLAGKPEARIPYASTVSYPDRLVRSTTGPDGWTTVEAPEERVPYASTDSYPDRIVRATTGPDAWTLAGKPERTAPYSDQDFPDRVLRARTAPDWSPTVGAPERTAPYSDQDFPDRVLRARTAPDDRTLWPFPLPTIAAPVEGYWSYPDKILRETTAPDAWTTVQRPERTSSYADQDFPERVIRAKTAPDWSPTVGSPERTQVPAYQSYPDRLVRATTAPDWSPTTGAPDERVPTGWTSYPDTVLRARGGPDNVTQAQFPPVPPSAWASYPDTVLGRPFLPTEQLAATQAQVPIRPPAAWSSYPDTVLGHPYPTIEQMVSTLWPQPIATPQTPAWYPDTVRGPLPRQGWDQAWQPHTTIPVLPNMVIWLGPKPIVVPVLAGAVIAPLLGKPVV